MADFPHLKLPYKVEGGYTPRGGGGKKLPTTIENITSKRKEHGDKLTSSIAKLRNSLNEFQELKKKGLSASPNEKDISVFLKIDTSSFPIEALRHWGIEIISEEENGLIIGASTDGLKSFEDNLKQFIEEKGKRKDTAGKIWDLELDSALRIDNLLKGDLKSQWGNLNANQEYFVELGVTCHVPMKMDYPRRNDFDKEAEYIAEIEEFEKHERDCQVARDEIQIQRENEIQEYVRFYAGNLIDIWDIGTDSIFFKIKINVNGLRDIVFGYQYLNSISFSPDFKCENIQGLETFDTEVELIPNESAARVCIIDSGIQEEHRLLNIAIDSASSKSYVNDRSGVGDFVQPSGHGTQVAGAVLYPKGVPREGQYKIPAILQNARILDANNEISDSKFAPSLLNKIVEDFPDTRIFNLSVAEKITYPETHMHQLSASIDKLIHENDKLFIIASGNLYLRTQNARHPGVNDHIGLGVDYPEYLEKDESRVANPGKSLFALTVGSIGHSNYQDEDIKAMAGQDFISPFSRTGFGMWDSIKPEVVEYGGDLASNKNTKEATYNSNLFIELVNSTVHGSPAISRETVGTSYSTPKVSHIVASLASELPDEAALMYKALVIQGARHPEHCFNNPSTRDFKFYGYGIANLERSLSNNPRRITFIQNGKLGGRKADIYKLAMPQELYGEGKDFKILVEITLTFTAKTKLTRKGAHSYLSTWLEWKTSKYGENFNSFRNRTIQDLELSDEELNNLQEGENAIKWILRENPDWSTVKINRNSSTTQKSWAFINPHQLTDDFSIAVLGHAGWDKNLKSEIPYALCVSFESTDPNIQVYQLMAEAQVPIPTSIEVEI